MNWYLEVLRKYAVFEGRARRTEYWMFFLFNLIFSIASGVLDGLLGTAAVLGTLYALGVLIPSLAVGVRRLHDTGRSGWWILVGFVPLIGWIVLIVFFATEGERGQNDYGPDPKEAAAPA